MDVWPKTHLNVFPITLTLTSTLSLTLTLILILTVTLTLTLKHKNVSGKRNYVIFQANVQTPWGKNCEENGVSEVSKLKSS